MFTNATITFWSLVMNGLADVDGFKICIQVCVLLGFPPLKVQRLSVTATTKPVQRAFYLRNINIMTRWHIGNRNLFINVLTVTFLSREWPETGWLTHSHPFWVTPESPLLSGGNQQHTRKILWTLSWVYKPSDYPMEIGSGNPCWSYRSQDLRPTKTVRGVEMHFSPPKLLKFFLNSPCWSPKQKCPLSCKRYKYIYVSLRLCVQNAVPAQPCVGKLGISLVLLNFLHCNFRLWFKTP